VSRLAVLALVVLVTACGGESFESESLLVAVDAGTDAAPDVELDAHDLDAGEDAPTVDAPTTCTPGQQASCACDGVTGSQLCGDAGAFGVCTHNGACCGAPGGWPACDGSGCQVCIEHVDAFPLYFVNHPECSPASGCPTTQGACSSACPPPTEADK
jgi:hypothetical protein